MLKCLTMLMVALVLPSVVFAQTVPQAPDPRTTPQALAALQAVLALREAELKALQDDFHKRESDWSAYSAPLWQAPAKP